MDVDVANVTLHYPKGLLSFVEYQSQLSKQLTSSELHGSNGFPVVVVPIFPPIPQGKLCIFLIEIVHATKDIKFIF